MSPRAEQVSVDGPAGPLQSIIEDPGAPAASFGVICHPHPLYGGSMDNKVVTSIARALHELGIPTVRFNFRGVGASAGQFDRGEGETGDAAAAATWASARWPGRGLILAGFSFGGYVALRLAARLSPALLITVAPAVQRIDAALSIPRCPWVLIQGEADEVVDPKEVRAWAEGLVPKPQLLLMPGVGHFFHGHLGELKAAVREAVRSG